VMSCQKGQILKYVYITSMHLLLLTNKNNSQAKPMIIDHLFDESWFLEMK